ncbi:SDR family oxidoreductase [Mycolicibacterium diernhoferi]|uniref:Short-chain dehydrogenase n=1 Tax=Mycolicibacterium diernhoferi TaxID=1801 RepID=A0A1Q4HH74_9MYCO|nr:SDR family oxidoreductase [Mycolicibacterium diernhoferi]OJZ66899.1 short-chain dehydrogenase [Mycolicibacterium diernhoferi]OPE45814.1 short-chain dehydrogenase [Mycolicibacterium diernhoferi]PEG51966.1 short-chain dehydrogenase [Mycolicibacterium diernhoferi]QYL23090.1 SDR family oxidoreductase [Mycolicibacterium diernhoferi]
MTERLDGRTVLVTGANGGLGTEFVRQALDRGAARVYATARRPHPWEDRRIVPLALDLTDLVSVAAAAETASDVDLLVNNAAIAPADDRSMLTQDEEITKRVFETNYHGTLRVARAFAPVLAANGGGAILNVLSLSAWLPLPTAYAASKAAAWSATNALRTELAGQHTAVTGLLVGMIDTAMSARWDFPKVSPDDVVAQAYDGVATGAFEVLADEQTRLIKSLLGAGAEELNAAAAEALSGFEP